MPPPHLQYFVWPSLVARRAHTQACSPSGSSPFFSELQPTPGGQHTPILAHWKGGHSCLGSWPPFGPKHAQWGSCLDSELTRPWPTHPVVSEKQSCHMLCGAWHCPGHTPSFIKNAHRPGKHWRFHPAPPVYSSHHGGWHPIPWLRVHCYHLLGWWTHLSVSPLTCGAHEHGHGITVKLCEVRLVTENTVPPMPEVPPSVHSPTHTAASLVIQSQSEIPGRTPRWIASSHKPVYNATNWQPLPNSVDHLHAQTRSQDETIVPDHLDWLSVFLGCG